MALKIITATERLQSQSGIKMLIVGRYGIGKTSLLKTLDPKTTLCLDFEAGLLSVRDWPGDVISIRTWRDAQDIACILGGVNPAFGSDSPYAEKAYSDVISRYSLPHYSRFTTLFIDSISSASKLCLAWAKETYKTDPRRAYGALADSMRMWIEQFQNMGAKHVIFVGLLDTIRSDTGSGFEIQLEGSKTGQELPAIVDQVLTLTYVDGQRVFITDPLNVYGFPAKDRSGKLGGQEPADLHHIITTILTPIAQDTTFAPPPLTTSHV